MVAEMEADSLEHDHELSEKLREKKVAAADDVEIDSVHGSFDSGPENRTVLVFVNYLIIRYIM